MAIILVRHGRVNYSTMALNDTGNAFAQALKKRFALRPIGKVVSMDPDRCVATVLPLANSASVSVETASSAAEIIQAIGESDWGASDLVVTFQYAVMGSIFSFLHLTPPAARDDAYGTVWIYDKGTGSVETIDTGLR